MGRKTALVVGATGLVGSNLVSILVESPEYEKVIVWVRNPTGIKNKKFEEKLIDFEKIESYPLDEKVNHVFCCLGTTIKKAKTKEAFTKVDLEYPLALARKAKEMGVSQFLVITAMGASDGSRIFYNKVKGQLEVELKKLGLKGLKIFRPSLLLGERNEVRFGEKAAETISKAVPFLFTGPFMKYKPIEGKLVANAMSIVAGVEKPGVEVFDSEEIRMIKK